MSYKDYGPYRPEVRKLLRRRLTVKDKIRRHQKKLESWQAELQKVECALDAELKKTGAF